VRVCVCLFCYMRVCVCAQTHCHADHISAAKYIQKLAPNHPPVGIGAAIAAVQVCVCMRVNLCDVCVSYQKHCIS